MPTYIEYEIEPGVSILVKVPKSDEAEEGIKAVARGEEETYILKSERKFGEALDSVRRASQAIRRQFADLRADEVEVTFGLTTTGKLGNFAIAEIGVEANYQVRLKWINP